MLWNKEDLRQFVQAKEYIDTLMVPLVPFTFEEDAEMEKKAGQGEIIRLFTREIEKEFKGRLVLSPEYTYLSQSRKEDEEVRLSQWVDNIKKQPFEHIFFFTFDSHWRKFEKKMEGTIIWVPGISGNDLSEEEVQKAVKTQLSDIKQFIRSYWT